MIPGSNILSTALSVIGRQCFTYYRFYKRSTGETGLDVNQYEAPVPMTGSVQPVPRELYDRLGLEFQKNFYIVYIEENIIDVDRDVGGDKFAWAGKTLQALSKTDWFPIDGWVGLLTVQINNMANGKC